MKKIFGIISIVVLVVLLTACKKTPQQQQTYCDQLSKVDGASSVKVGMVTDSGTITDKSFNEGTWNGIKCYESKNPATTQYIQPGGEAETDYLAAIKNLTDAGYQIIVAPGFKFETAILKAQDLYPNTKFVLIDGLPNNGVYDETRVEHVGDNTVSIFFAEHQAGFLAGVSAALETKTNKLGFVGGMEIPAVQKFGWGFVAGVAYANKTYGTNAKVIDYVYQGTFNDIAGGQTLAAGMYDKGIDIIFHAAGGVGNGVFAEAKTRAENGAKVFVIGVDSDQYEFGRYGDGSKSVTLTSALKRVDVAAYDQVGLFATNKWSDVGGQVLNLDINDNAVGLPLNNPNLQASTSEKTTSVANSMKANTIVVPANYDDLMAYLTANNYTTPTNVTYKTAQ